MSITLIDDPKIFIGMTMEAARREIVAHGYDVRVIQFQTPYKPEYDPLRIILIVQKDEIIDAKVG